MTIREKISDLLKAAGVNIEGNLLHFSPSRKGGIYLKQKGRVNIAIITPTGTEALVERGEIEKAITRSRNELSALSRIDLAGYDIITLSAQAEDHDLLKMCKKVLEERDLQALSIAMTVRKYEMLSQSRLALDFREKLRRKYGERGNRIYVFYTTSLMREFLMPLLAWVEFTPTITEINRAREVFERCIEHMEHAVYVNHPMPRERVVDEIRYRFLVDRVNVVLVFGRTEPIIMKIRWAVKEFLKLEAERQIEKREYNVREHIYRWGSVEAITVIIAKK